VKIKQQAFSAACNCTLPLLPVTLQIASLVLCQAKGITSLRLSEGLCFLAAMRCILSNIWHTDMMPGNLKPSTNNHTGSSKDSPCQVS